MSSSSHSAKPGSARKSFWTAPRIVLTVALLGFMIALGISRCNSGEETNKGAVAVRSNGESAPPAKNPPAANAFVSVPQQLREARLQTLEGQPLKLSDYAGKVLVVNLWATWCGPCRAEMPELVKLNKEYKERGLVVIGLATKYNEHNDAEGAKAFARSQNVDYKIIWDDGSFAAPLVQIVHGHDVIPQSFVISRDGRIVKHFEGFSPYSTPPLMRQAIEEALNEKSKA
jgi:thiol-disulfide isomerase/thioredoxin